jgi:hypothetical protein
VYTHTHTRKNKKKMKVAIVGYRNFSDYKLFCDHIESWEGDIDYIVSGGAKGTDTMAAKYARENGIPFKIFHAKWKEHGKRAGPIRNKQIVDFCDCVIAFLSPLSVGTKDTLAKAKRCGKPVTKINI